jgi:mRNA interferase HicA
MSSYPITIILDSQRIQEVFKEQGSVFEDKKRHTIFRLGNRCSLLPRHPAKEIKTGTLNGILKDLGLKFR